MTTGLVDVTAYGALGNGSDASASTNAAAFAAAIAALPANGGQILVPVGRYHTNGPFANLLNRRAIEFVGLGSGNGALQGIGASEIVYTADTGQLINLDGTQAITFRNLAFSYNSSTYTAGNALIKLRTVSGSSDTTQTLFENIFTGGWNSSARNALLYDITKATLTTFKRGYMHNAYYGIVGAHAAGDFSNVVVIDGIEFDAPMRLAILVGGLNWRLSNITGEPVQGTAGGASITFCQVSPLGVRALMIDHCSLEDGGDNTGAWFDFASASDFGAAGLVGGLTAIGNTIMCGAAFAFNFGTAGLNGGLIAGNYFNSSRHSGFIYDGTTMKNVTVTNNYPDTDSGPGTGVIFLGANVPTGNSVYDNNDGLGLQYTGRVQLAPSTTARAGLNLGASGAAPTSPVNGDMWFDGTNVKVRVGGVTKTFTLT